jgi:uncharacterized membrane protein (DUF373 family)
MSDHAPTPVDRALRRAETLVYVLVGGILVVGSLVLVIEAIGTFFQHFDDGVVQATTDTLSVLLIVFIFVELLGATRVIIREQRLVAEPFLLVGIIAAIKEIVVVAGAERPAHQDFETFRDAMIEIGVLAGIVLILSVSSLLLRRATHNANEKAT